MAASASSFLSLTCICGSERTLKASWSYFDPTRVEAKRQVLCFSSKKKLGLMDQILDYIEGGPKLRKWYGAPDLLPKDGSATEEEEEPTEEEIKDAVLVTDGDSEIGQMVILSLIVKRIRVKALVKDKRAAMEAFGTYVELSVYRGESGIQAILNGNSKKRVEQDESALVASGIPYTIIRAGALKSTPGGQGISFEKDCAGTGSLSKEDAAFICVAALDAVPEKGFMFEVVNGEEKVLDWKECFEVLMSRSD